MGVSGNETKVGSGRWMRLILVASLALNLLVVGAVGGVLIMSGGKHPHHAPGFDRAGGPMTRALSHEDRREIGRQMRAAYRDGRPGRTAQREALDGLITALRADPFERAVVQSRMSEMRNLMRDRLELGETLLLDRLEAMSPQERAEYADRLTESNRRR